MSLVTTCDRWIEFRDFKDWNSPIWTFCVSWVGGCCWWRRSAGLRLIWSGSHLLYLYCWTLFGEFGCCFCWRSERGERAVLMLRYQKRAWRPWDGPMRRMLKLIFGQVVKAPDTRKVRMVWYLIDNIFTTDDGDRIKSWGFWSTKSKRQKGNNQEHRGLS